MVSTKIGDKPLKSSFSSVGLGGSALDKLAQLRQNIPQNLSEALNSNKCEIERGKEDNASNSLKTLSKRARGKYLTNGFLNKLRNLDSPLRKGYLNSYFCSSVLQRTGQKITATYCGNRWCINCNRIRTAVLINGYSEPLSALEDPHFVTLTIPGKNSGEQIPGNELKEVIEQMTKNFRSIINDRTTRRKGIRFNGIRKFECTYSVRRNDFHPHLHIIINKKENAEFIRNEWLKKYPLGNLMANDVRPCDEGSLKEIFKYFTKLLNNKKFYPQAQDIMFQAMKGMRVIQPFGNIKKVTEEIETLRAEKIEDLSSQENATYKYQEGKTFADWIDLTTGEMLTGYCPSEEVKKMRESV